MKIDWHFYIKCIFSPSKFLMEHHPEVLKQILHVLRIEKNWKMFSFLFLRHNGHNQRPPTLEQNLTKVLCTIVNRNHTLIPVHLSSPAVFSGVQVSCCSIFSFVCNVLQIMVLFLLTIALSLFLWLKASDYPFDIFKLFSLLKYLLRNHKLCTIIE